MFALQECQNVKYEVKMSPFSMHSERKKTAVTLTKKLSNIKEWTEKNIKNCRAKRWTANCSDWFDKKTQLLLIFFHWTISDTMWKDNNLLQACFVIFSLVPKSQDECFV